MVDQFDSEGGQDSHDAPGRCASLRGSWCMVEPPIRKIGSKIGSFPHLRVNMKNYLKLKPPPSIASFTFVGGIDIQIIQSF